MLSDKTQNAGQTEPRAIMILLRREKRLEQVGLHFRAHAATRIRDSKARKGARISALVLPGLVFIDPHRRRADSQQASLRHCFNGIGKKVMYNLLNKCLIACNRGQVFPIGLLQRNFIPKPARTGFKFIFHDSIQIKHLRMHGVAAHERKQLPCKIRS